jgi:hypothetical protein
MSEQHPRIWWSPSEGWLKIDDDGYWWERLDGAVVEVLPSNAVEFAPVANESEALTLLRELVAGADDHRCWWIPDEIADRARELVERRENHA